MLMVRTMESEGAKIDRVVQRTKALSESCHKYEREIAALENSVEQNIMTWEGLLDKVGACDEQVATLKDHIESSAAAHRQSTLSHISQTRQDTNKAYQDVVSTRSRLEQAVKFVYSRREIMTQLDEQMTREEAVHETAVQYQQIFIASGFILVSIITSIALAWWFS